MLYSLALTFPSRQCQEAKCLQLHQTPGLTEQLERIIVQKGNSYGRLRQDESWSRRKHGQAAEMELFLIQL